MRKSKKKENLRDEFKEFAGQTAVLSTAIGIMMGAALKDVIDSLVENILTPPIDYITSGVDLTKLYFVLGNGTYSSLNEALEAGAIVIQYGKFVSSFVSFFITVVILFIFLYKGRQALQKALKKEEEKKVRTTKKCPYCMSEIDKKATRCPNCTSKL